MSNFETLVKALTKAKVPCKVKELKDQEELIVECGWDYPDKLFFKVDDIATSLNIQVEVCADHTGGTVINSIRLNGGPQRY